ncbi:hypothetical protein Q4I28_000015, partial [Leishmania naiffi]
MTSYSSTFPNAKVEALTSISAAAPTTSDVDSCSFEVVAGDYVPNAQRKTGYRPGPYLPKPLFSDPNASTRLQPFHQEEEWGQLGSVHAASGGTLGTQGCFH